MDRETLKNHGSHRREASKTGFGNDDKGKLSRLSVNANATREVVPKPTHSRRLRTENVSKTASPQCPSANGPAFLFTPKRSSNSPFEVDIQSSTQSSTPSTPRSLIPTATSSLTPSRIPRPTSAIRKSSPVPIRNRAYSPIKKSPRTPKSDFLPGSNSGNSPTATRKSPSVPDVQLSDPPIPNPPPTLSQTRVPSPLEATLPPPLPRKPNVQHESVAIGIRHPAMVALNWAAKGLSLLMNILGIFCLIALLFAGADFYVKSSGGHSRILESGNRQVSQAFFKAAHLIEIEYSGNYLVGIQIPLSADPASSHSSLTGPNTVVENLAKSDIALESRPIANYKITFKILLDSIDSQERSEGPQSSQFNDGGLDDRLGDYRIRFEEFSGFGAAAMTG
ncbi:hypothetical protein RUND412_011447 [Rhizina undulata]